MLISHRHQFIFLKTVKTASTSVEALLEPFCIPVTQSSLSVRRSASVTEDGIVGQRAARPSSEWFNHMSAQRVRDQIGPDIWDTYQKFTTIRNPYTKLISGFFYFTQPERTGKGAIIQTFRLWLKDLHRCAEKFSDELSDQSIPHYALPIELSLLDRDKYFVESTCCVNSFIKFENLTTDLKTHLHNLQLDVDISALAHLQSSKKQQIEIWEYYDSKHAALVEELYDWEINHFGYRLGT